MAISLSLSPRDDEGARGGSPDRCVCPRPPRVTQLLLTLLPSGGSYTNFQECLPPHPSATLESPFPGSPFSFSTHLPAPAPRVSIATWRRVFAYYTLCVTEADSLCMPARLCMWIYIYVYLYIYNLHTDNSLMRNSEDNNDNVIIIMITIITIIIIDYYYYELLLLLYCY